MVATVLTACGIETKFDIGTYRTHQYKLQQCLPLAVLKPNQPLHRNDILIVATVLTACGIETVIAMVFSTRITTSCNSAYRLQYATKGASRGVKRR